MTESQLKRIAREIAEMQGVVPDEHRLRFAYAIRDVILQTRKFPEYRQFIRDCKLEKNL